jgi:hypothetical protein
MVLVVSISVVHPFEVHLLVERTEYFPAQIG